MTDGGYRSALRVPEFRAVFAAHTVAMAGAVMANFALTVLVYTRTRSPLLSGIVFTIVLAPHLIGGTFLSALVDRIPARRLLVACNLVSAALAATMAARGMPIAALLVLALALGMVETVFIGARAATLPDVLPGAAYVPGRSLMRMVAQGAQTVGYAISGLLMTTLAPAQVLLLNAGCFVASALILRFGTRKRGVPGRGSQHSLLRDSLSGLGQVIRVPALRDILVLGWAVPALAVVPEALAVPYAASWQASPLAAGLLMSSIPVGTLLGEIVASNALPATWQVRLIYPAVVGLFVPLLIFVARPVIWLAVLALFISGTFSWFHLGQDRRLLDAAPEDLRGRALSIQSAGLMFWQGVGFALAGAAAELLAPSLVIFLAAVIGIAFGLFIAVGSRRRDAGPKPVPDVAHSER
ncbi:MFS transporter [Micromonospora eburnea]|uniref:Major Facilitator Superfamily protein n=1 Tax=Micromonospora eburnea TaxID=227316 RepID=A0A1C6UW10_9ACTN|nr:MFS transporter [Micromonospora eburnea]SCL58043.1 Major Facilitator Superfamily protein [Micromonospora eburnea]